MVIRKDNKIVHGRNVVCNRCGLVYVWPRMTEEELDEFYRDEYRNVYATNKSQITHKMHAQNAYSFIKDLPGKHLDVGCSTGELIKLTGGAGIEPNTEHYEIAKAGGLDVTNCKIEDYAGNTFDVVTMLNTLEHLMDPMSALVKMRGLLNDGGYLLVTVPNLLSTCLNLPVDAFLSNAHLYNFTPYTLTLMMLKAGFEIRGMYPVFEKIGEKIYVLAQKGLPVDVNYHCPAVELLQMFLHYANLSFELKYRLMEG